jgi:hypothetical protein
MKRLFLAITILFSVLVQAQIANTTDYLKDTKAELAKLWPQNRTINLVFHGHSVPSGYFKTPDVRTFSAYPMLLLKEIKSPGSFSIRTIKLISQLDNQAAKLFQLFCSQAIALKVDSNIIEVRVVSLDGNAGSNSLSKYGLSFDNLNTLQEYGLIISDYNSWRIYSSCISNKLNTAVFSHQNKDFHFVPLNSEKFDKELKLNGVVLTKAGNELFNIIPIEASENYTIDLFEFPFLGLWLTGRNI